MPKRRKRTEAEKLRWRLAAPGILLLGAVFGATPSELNAEETLQNVFTCETVTQTAPEICLGQRTLSQMLFFGPSLRLPGSRQPNTFDLPNLSVSRYRTWLRGFGHWSSIEAQGQTQGLEYYSYGVSVGIDQQFGRNFLLGLALGGSKVSVEIDEKEKWKSNVSAAHGSIYFRTTLHQLYFDVEGGIGYNDQSRPSSNSLQWNINGEAGTWWGHGLGRIESFLGLRHVSSDLDPGTETKTTLIGGVRYSWKTTGKYAVITPRFYGGVLHELGDRNLMNAALFVDAPTVFSIPDYKIAGTRFFFGGGFTSAMGRSLDLYLRYTAELASGQTSHTAMLGMNWNF